MNDQSWKWKEDKEPCPSQKDKGIKDETSYLRIRAKAQNAVIVNGELPCS
jgi:hypothetical protein